MDDMSAGSIESEGWNDGMDFEYCMRRLFGDKAYHIASCNTDPEERTKWIKKFLAQIIIDTQSIDIHENQRDVIERKLRTIERQSTVSSKPQWDIVFQLLDIIAHLVGYSGVDGRRTFDILHWETKENHFERLNGKGQADELHKRIHSTGEKRADLIESMKVEGYNDFDISLVFNMSEYQVKKTRRARARGRG